MPSIKLRKRLQTNYRSSSAFKTLKCSMTNKKVAKNGELIDQARLRKRSCIKKANQLMEQQGLLEIPASKQTTQKMSHDFMCSIGYTVTISEQEYTLVDSQSEDDMFDTFLVANIQPIENMDIVTIDLTKSFPNQFDPLYVADDHMPESLQSNPSAMSREMVENLDLVNTAMDFSSLAVTKTNSLSTSRYFNNEKINIGVRATKTARL